MYISNLVMVIGMLLVIIVQQWGGRCASSTGVRALVLVELSPERPVDAGEADWDESNVVLDGCVLNVGVEEQGGDTVVAHEHLQLPGVAHAGPLLLVAHAAQEAVHPPWLARSVSQFEIKKGSPVPCCAGDRTRAKR